MTRILIVDDREDNRYLLRSLLGGNGFEIDEARHGAEALARARQVLPDLVIADLFMPVMDGFMLLRQWKADPALKQVPFVVYTATYTEAQDEALARDLGADEFILKPADPDVFIRRMREVIARAPTHRPEAVQKPILSEREALAAYNQILVDKLTQKVEQLDAANAKLRDGEAQYRALFEVHPHPMWIFDRATLRFLAVNDAAIKHYGYGRDEFLAMTLADIRPSEDMPRLREIVATAGDGPVHDAGLWRHRLRDGREINVELRSYPTTWFGQRAELVVVDDITARLDAERSVAMSERRFRATFEQAAVGFALVAPDGRFIEVNQRLCEIVGYGRDELCALTFQQITHPDDLAPDLALVQEMLAGTRTAYSLEKRYFHKLGQIVWIDLTVALVRQADGAPDYFVAVIEDISARRRAEETLRKLSRAVEQTSESIVITDAAGRMEYVNESFVHASGYLRDELLGNNSRMLQSGATPRKTFEDLWATITSGRTWVGEFVNRRKDGHVYIEAATISPLREADGRITHYVGVKEDVTERRRTEQELERHRLRLEELVRERTAQLDAARAQAEAANEAKSTFLASMSHEIRTPMNGVLGMLEILEHSDLTATQAEMVRTARESGRTLLGLIDDILDLSKIEAGRMQIDTDEVDLIALAEGLIDSLLPVAARQAVDLAVFVDPALPDQVMADPLRLRQILFNLLGNAIKFSGGAPDHRGKVVLRVAPVAEDSTRIAFTVSDQGIGMTAEALARLFQPFSQAEASTTRRFGGTGLGLAICRRLANLMGGEISATSAPGAGATFTLILPLVNVPHPAERRLPDLRGLHCAVQVAPEFQADAIAAYLAAAGAKVELAPPSDRSRIVIHAGERALTTVSLSGEPGKPLRLDAPGVPTLECGGLRRAPLLQAVAQAAGRATESPASATTDRVRQAAPAPSGEPILVAEDDPVNRLVITKQLGLLGHAVDVTHNGAEALARWRELRHAVILTDLHMPELDGYELARAIRRIEASENTPRRTAILALTANALRGEADRARAAGIDDYLTKPLPIEELREKLRPHRTGASRPAVFDASVPQRMLGDAATAREFVGRFRQLLPTLRDALHEACAAGDAEAAGQAAHRLKAATRAAGALALGDRCARVEAAAHSGGDLGAHAAAIVAEADATAAAIDAWIQAS